jgi:hypothetical protein
MGGAFVEIDEDGGSLRFREGFFLTSEPPLFATIRVIFFFFLDCDR